MGLFVFIDGCFWHGCPLHFVEPKTRREFWLAKIAGNQRRDLETTERLESLGYTVLRSWEHDDPEEVARRIAATYRLLRQQS